MSLHHLKGLRRWRGGEDSDAQPPDAQYEYYDAVDAYDKNVRVYVYAEKWGRQVSDALAVCCETTAAPSGAPSGSPRSGCVRRSCG